MEAELACNYTGQLSCLLRAGNVSGSYRTRYLLTLDQSIHDQVLALYRPVHGQCRWNASPLQVPHASPHFCVLNNLLVSRH